MRQVRTTEPLVTGVPDPRTEPLRARGPRGRGRAGATALTGSGLEDALSQRPRVYRTELGSFWLPENKAPPQFVT